MNRLKGFLIFGLIMSATLVGLYFFSSGLERYNKYRISQVNKDYRSAKGIIIAFYGVKQENIAIKYTINKEIFEFNCRIDRNPKPLSIGDSILIKYAKKNPKFVITELEQAYDMRDKNIVIVY